MSTQNWPEDTTPRLADGSPADGGTQGGDSTKDAAKGEARQVGKEGAEASQHVAGVAKNEARGVADEAKGQARNLMHELNSDLKSQADSQQQKVAEGLRSISDEFGSMAQNSEQNGMATQWVSEASRRTGDVAGWLDQRDSGGLLDETKRFARNRPGTFLAIAAGAGLLAGRLGRGMKDAGSGSGEGSMDSGRRSAAPAVAPTSGAAAEGGADAARGSTYPPSGGADGGRIGATAREDQAMPDLASPQAPGYSPGFPDSEPGPANPAYPDDDARGLNEGRDKR